MSDRMPLNESAQRRRPEPAPMSAETSDAPQAGSRPARQRKPFGTREQKLAYAQRPGYHRHWFNDEPGRIDRAKDAGYIHVKDLTTGENVKTVVGRGRDGTALIGYLMECPEEWYVEDMAANEADVRDLLGEIRQGRAPGTPSGADGAARYIPKQGISIREDRR